MYIVLIFNKDGTRWPVIMMIRFSDLVIYSDTSFCQYLYLMPCQWVIIVKM